MPLGRKGLLERLVLLVSPDALVGSALEDQWEKRASQERRGPSGQLDRTGRRGLWGCPGLLAPLGLQERTETRARQEDQARRAVKETKENLALQDLLESRDLSAIRGHRVWTGSRGRGASRGCTGRRETREREVTRGPQDPLDYRACQDSQERRETVDTWARWALQDNMAPEAPRGPSVERALLASLVEWASLGSLERRGRMERLGTRDQLETLVPLVVKGSWGRRVTLAPPEQQDLQESEARQGRTDPKETLGPLGSQEILDPLEKQGSMELMVDREQRETTVILGKPDPQEPLENRALQGPPGEGGTWELLEKKGNKE